MKRKAHLIWIVLALMVVAVGAKPAGKRQADADLPPAEITGLADALTICSMLPENPKTMVHSQVSPYPNQEWLNKNVVGKPITATGQVMSGRSENPHNLPPLRRIEIRDGVWAGRAFKFRTVFEFKPEELDMLKAKIQYTKVLTKRGVVVGVQEGPAYTMRGIVKDARVGWNAARDDAILALNVIDSEIVE